MNDDLPDLTDEQIRDLCTRLRDGDPAAHQELFLYLSVKLKPFAHTVLRMDFAHIGLQEETNDIVHDVILKLIPYLRTQGEDFCSGIGPFQRLTATVIRRTLISLARKRFGSLNGHSLVEDADATNPMLWQEDGLDDWRAQFRVHELIDKLEDDNRDILELAIYTNLSNNELARCLKIAPGTASRRLTKAKEALGKLVLEDEQKSE